MPMKLQSRSKFRTIQMLQNQSTLVVNYQIFKKDIPINPFWLEDIEGKIAAISLQLGDKTAQASSAFQQVGPLPNQASGRQRKWRVHWSPDSEHSSSRVCRGRVCSELSCIWAVWGLKCFEIRSLFFWGHFWFVGNSIKVSRCRGLWIWGCSWWWVLFRGWWATRYWFLLQTYSWIARNMYTA